MSVRTRPPTRTSPTSKVSVQFLEVGTQFLKVAPDEVHGRPFTQWLGPPVQEHAPSHHYSLHLMSTDSE